MHNIKLSVDLSIPDEPEYKPCVLEKVQDAMERVEFNDDTNAYNYLRKLVCFASKQYKAGKRSEKLHKILGLLVPFMVKYGLEDHRGMDLVEEYVTNPDYKEDHNEQD